MADQARLMLADGHRRLGESGPAAAEYDRLATQTGDTLLLVRARLGAAEVLDQAGEPEESAARYAKAADVAAGAQQVHLAAACRCAEVQGLSRAGLADRAQAALLVAEQVVRSVPGEPAAGCARSWGMLHHAATQVLAAAGRVGEAADRATAAVAAFEAAGATAEATEARELREQLLADPANQAAPR
jgi:hypothetical protein